MKLARVTILCAALLLVGSLPGWSQSSPAEAFTNVTIHTADGNSIESGTIVWRDGIITAVGQDVSIPFDAYVRDGGDSLHVYPGFLDGMAYWGSPKRKEYNSTPDEPGNPGYDRAGIQPQRHPVNFLKSDGKDFTKAQKLGFTTAGLGLKGEMLPGQVDLVFVNGDNTSNYLLESGIGVLAQFEEAQGAAYPSTTMALMARYRQLFYDARAQMEQQKYFAATSSNYPAPNKEKQLQALYPVLNQQQPFYFVADTKEDIERLFWLQDELGFNLVIVSGKEAYAKADELVKREIPVLASIELPEEPQWRVKEEDSEEEKEKAEEVEVTEEMRIFRERQLQAYETSVENITQLLNAGVKVGYASNGLKLSEVRDHMTTLLEESDLSEKQLLQILTRNTADILGYNDQLGDIEEGRLASFSVFTKPFTSEEARVAFSVSDGKVSEFESETSKKEGE